MRIVVDATPLSHPRTGVGNYLRGSLRGLAEAQIIGVTIGTLSSIFVACPLLLLMHVSKQDLMPKAKDEAALARRP